MRSLQAEEVEFHQARLLDPFHVELGDRHVGLRVAVERHQLGQRPVGDDDAGGVGGGMTREAFELARDVEGALDHGIAVALGLQPRLILDGAAERNGIGRVLRHQLAELVDLAVGHLQHAADVAQHAARLQRAEGDDLRHLIAAVALLHIADHLVAALLAEVDVEVRHRHAVGIEKALEQKAEADRIEVGDGERISDQRAGARAAPGADRNALRLRPLDEIGDDQEVAGIFHALDDAELEIEPLAVFILRDAGRQPCGGEALRQPLRRALAQFGRLIERAAALARREARQDRLMGVRAEGAAFGDFDGRGQRLRQVGKLRDHVGAALETMLGRELAAVGFTDQPAFGDADQRVVRFMVGRGREERLVGGDQRQAFGIGQVDQHRLADAFATGAVPLQFDIEPAVEQALQRLKARAGEMALAGRDRGVERPARAAGERDNALGFALKPGKLQMRRLVRRRVEEGAGIEPHEAAIAGIARGQQHDARALMRRIGVARAMIGVAEIDTERAADDGLHARAGQLLGEFQRPEHVVGVGERERGLLVGFGELGQPRKGNRAFQQRIVRVYVQVHEIEIGHGDLKLG